MGLVASSTHYYVILNRIETLRLQCFMPGTQSSHAQTQECAHYYLHTLASDCVDQIPVAAGEF